MRALRRSGVDRRRLWRPMSRGGLCPELLFSDFVDGLSKKKKKRWAVSGYSQLAPMEVGVEEPGMARKRWKDR
jgi:hypothetical protein